MTAPDVAEVCKGLTPRPRLALLNWGAEVELAWTEVVERAGLPSDAKAMSYRATLLPLLDRGLAYLAFEGAYHPETQAVEWKRYALTEAGETVRRHLLENPDAR